MRRQIYCAALALSCSMTVWGTAFAPAFAMCDPRFGPCDYPAEAASVAEAVPAKPKPARRPVAGAHIGSAAIPTPRPRPMETAVAAVLAPDPEPVGQESAEPALATVPVRAPAPASTMRSKARIPAALAFSLTVTPQSLREVLSPHSACLLERAFNDTLAPLAVGSALGASISDDLPGSEAPADAERRIASSDAALPDGRFRRAE